MKTPELLILEEKAHGAAARFPYSGYVRFLAAAVKLLVEEVIEERAQTAFWIAQHNAMAHRCYQMGNKLNPSGYDREGRPNYDEKI